MRTLPALRLAKTSMIPCAVAVTRPKMTPHPNHTATYSRYCKWQGYISCTLDPSHGTNKYEILFLDPSLYFILSTSLKTT